MTPPTTGSHHAPVCEETTVRRTAVVCVTRLGLITRANHAAQRLLELTPDDYGLLLTDALPDMAQSLRGDAKAFQTRLNVQLRSGRRITALVQCEPVTSDVRCLLVQDLEAASPHQDRRRRAEQLQAAVKMASRLSHEIKNPLAAVIAGLQTLETQTYLDPDDCFVLELALGEARAIHRIIDSFSEGARVEPSRIDPVRPVDVLEKCVAAVAPIALKRNLTIELRQGPENARFYADERVLIHALTKLIWNAIEASPPDSALSLGWRELGAHETQAVAPGFPGRVVGIFGEDRGKGLPDDLSISTIFRPFVTTKASSVGLGLAVAQEIIESHGGVVALCARPGGGAVFEALFPVAEDTDQNSKGCRNACAMPGRVKSTFCWIVQGAERRIEKGVWMEECRTCAYFRARNLALYHRPRPMERD